MSELQIVGLVLGLVSLLGNIVQYVKKSALERAFRGTLQGVQGELGHALGRVNELVWHTERLAKQQADIGPETLRAVYLLSGNLRGHVEGVSEFVQRFSREYLKLHLPTSAQIIEESKKK